MPSGKLAPSGTFAAAVSEEIRALMARKRVSGIELANSTGMSQNYIAKRLRDDFPFTLNDVEMICQALGTDHFELISASRRHGAPDFSERWNKL